jgi:hypothetical protein
MDWALAIERNRQPLLRIVATLFAMIGLAEGGTVARLSRPLHRAVLGVLRPAEAAVRRLIIIAAQGMVVKPYRLRPAPAGLSLAGKGQGGMAFRLFDPRRRRDGVTGFRRTRGPGIGPRIRVIGSDFDPRIPPFLRPGYVPPAAPPPDNTVNAVPLCRRLAAIKAALEDLPRQARRYVRWRARPGTARRPEPASALRPGSPPGSRKNADHEVQAILAECHGLALAVAGPDTS